jgi:hypothetical protein
MLAKYLNTLRGSAAFAPPDLSRPIDEGDERYLTGPQVRERYSVSEMWIFRQYKRREEIEQRHPASCVAQPTSPSSATNWRSGTSRIPIKILTLKFQPQRVPVC